MKLKVHRNWLPSLQAFLIMCSHTDVVRDICRFYFSGVVASVTGTA
jgi:hypothetical protein